MLRTLARLYSAGTFGALCNFGFGLLLTLTGAFAALGVALPPPNMPGALYSRLVWGGIWGLLLLLPLPKTKIVQDGLILGIAPSLVAGLIFFPKAGLGYFGVGAGAMMVPLIFVFNWIWGSGMLWFERQIK
jgi:hypothetical protein